MQLVWAKKQFCSVAFVCALVLMVGGVACTPMTVPDPPPGQALDADGDGVTDANDDCANTREGATVDARGCTVGVADADGDGVLDGDDQCTNTPANTTVDATGCPVGGPDADGDGVSDDIDTCDNTAAGSTVDILGCAASQRDSDNDGFTDDVDECANTAPDANIDDKGCPVSAGGPDTDGDGVNDDIDRCENTADGASVDANGCASNERDTDMDGVIDSLDDCMNTPRGTSVDAAGCPLTSGGGGGGGGVPPGSVCGNNVVESGEQCDPPDGTTCDTNCQTTAGGALTNDSCLTPIAIGEGDRSFSNTDATTDGPDEADAPAGCSLGSYTHVESDIWYLYTSTCPNLVIVSLCGSLYDTKMMIYEGSGCPVDADLPFACSDDDCGAIANSRAIFTAVTGQDYLIRIGGFQGEQGDGTLTIYCGNDPGRGPAACGAGAGDCFDATNNNTPGCDDGSACNQTCQIDPFCCDTAWDQTCAAKANGIVNGFPACIGSTNACDVEAANGMGCSDQTCCQSVCEEDAFCCTTLWDNVCAERAAALCP